MSAQPEYFGKYILLEKIATGGMAEVYLAKATGAENVAKYFAVKRILPQFSQNQEFIEMFKEEAKIAVNLSHSNVVSIYEFGEHAGQFYIVMEFVEGRNLRQILNKLQKGNQRLALDQIVYVINEVSRGLDHAHRCVDGATGRPLQITHRDMSPQNVMISFEGEVKIVDFGIAKAESKLETTKAGTLKGKFGYMSPEQAEGQEVDARTDIFSLGIVLWELVAGERLFISNNEVNTLRKIRDCVVPSLRKIDPNIPAELERITNKSLARDRNLRYQNTSEMQRDLHRFLARQYPDFTPSDFSTFIKSVFEKEREELRGKMIEYGKISSQSIGEKTEYIGDHTQTVTETNNKKRPGSGTESQLQNFITNNKIKADEVSLDLQFKRGEILKQAIRPSQGIGTVGESSGLTSKSSVGLPPFGTNTGYTATSHKESSLGKVVGFLLIAALGGGGYYSVKVRPEISKMVLAKLSSVMSQEGHEDPAVEGKAQIASITPSTTLAPTPPQPTSLRVTVRSSPMGATIQVDGTAIEAKTPAEIDLPANKPVKITLTKQGYAPHQRETVFNKDGDAFDATLQRADLAYVNITVRPTPANIYVDRKYVGRSPMQSLPVPAGKTVEILAYDPDSKAQDSEKIVLKIDNTRDVELFLRRPVSGTGKGQTPKRGTSSQKSK